MSPTAGKNVDIRPATGKLGNLLPGMGAVATTFIAGVEAIRRGMALLDTPFVCFLDSDDVWYDGFVARHLAVHRGVSCSPEQILVTNGPGEGIQLIARLLLRPGDDEDGLRAEAEMALR